MVGEGKEVVVVLAVRGEEVVDMEVVVCFGVVVGAVAVAVAVTVAVTVVAVTVLTLGLLLRCLFFP